MNRDQVIIKMIKESAETNKIALQEFDLEFGTLARLDHPSIIKILGAGRAPRYGCAAVYVHVCGVQLDLYVPLSWEHRIPCD